MSELLADGLSGAELPFCAVAGCTSTGTVPHHVKPFWWTRLTRYRDMIPICEHCHHDVHDGPPPEEG